MSNTLTIPNTFTDDTDALAADVNANFSAISTFLNSTGVNDDNIQTGGVGSDSIANDAVITSKILDANVTLAKLAAAVAAALVPTGSVIGFGGTAAPTGYLLCDGSPVSQSTYASLYAVIGVAHGDGTKNADGTSSGHASGYFNLPDHRGKFLRGVDGGAGHDPDAASRTAMNTGGNTGDAVGSMQADAFASHNHHVTYNSAGAFTAPSLDAGHGVASDVPTGSTGGNETRPKNANVNFIIKT
jgi:microcystin-dependent protein